jgi:hypothetical protein
LLLRYSKDNRRYGVAASKPEALGMVSGEWRKTAGKVRAGARFWEAQVLTPEDQPSSRIDGDA